MSLLYYYVVRVITIGQMQKVFSQLFMCSNGRNITAQHEIIKQKKQLLSHFFFFWHNCLTHYIKIAICVY